MWEDLCNVNTADLNSEQMHTLITLQLSQQHAAQSVPSTSPLRLGPLRLFLVHRKRKAVRAATHILSRARLGAAKRAPALGTRVFEHGAICSGPRQVPLTPHKADALIDTARRSTHHLSERDPHFFYENLPAREHWRLFAEFRDDTAYFDIETTGLGGPGGPHHNDCAL